MKKGMKRVAALLLASVLAVPGLSGLHPAQAEACFMRMIKSHRCDFCHYGGCYEAYLGMGILRMYQRRFDEAEEYFRRCLQAYPYCSQARYYLNIRRKW